MPSICRNRMIFSLINLVALILEDKTIPDFTKLSNNFLFLFGDDSYSLLIITQKNDITMS